MRLLCRFLCFMLLAVMLTEGQLDSEIRQIYGHLRQMEGFRLVGYIPTPLSGVTIATGVDLGQWTTEHLEQLGVPDTLLQKLSSYTSSRNAPLKTQAQVEAAGLNASNLKITSAEAWELDKGLLGHNIEQLARNFGQLSVKGRAVLISLRHWNGSLKNSRNDGKLTREVDGKLISYVNEAVRHNKATDEDLVQALQKTKATFQVGTSSYNRISKEISYLGRQSATTTATIQDQSTL